MPLKNLRPNHILLADDDEDDRALFGDALREVAPGVELTAVTNGVELMQALRVHPSSHPDLLFIDLNMPLKNGFECLREIKQDTALQHIPVIILSTSSIQDALAEMGEHRPDLYVRKPSTFPRLKNVISKILSPNLRKELDRSAVKPLAVY